MQPWQNGSEYEEKATDSTKLKLLDYPKETPGQIVSEMNRELLILGATTLLALSLVGGLAWFIGAFIVPALNDAWQVFH